MLYIQLRGRTLLKQRIITALILASLVILGIFFLPIPGFIAAVAVITLIGFWEWTQFVSLSERLKAMIIPVVTLIGSLFILPISVPSLMTRFPAHHHMLILGGLWWLLASLLTITYSSSAQYWAKSAALKQLFGLLTLIPFFWAMLLLRADNYLSSHYLGAKLLLLVCLIVWSADSGAYFCGKRFGRTKMAPSVSPNKTIEGLFGGIVLAVIVAWVGAEIMNIPFSSVPHLLFIAIVTVVASVFGDLVESMFKRVSGIKDSGRILPGHGGVLDRIDSLTAALPVFALLYFW